MTDETEQTTRIVIKPLPWKLVGNHMAVARAAGTTYTIKRPESSVSGRWEVTLPGGQVQVVNQESDAVRLAQEHFERVLLAWIERIEIGRYTETHHGPEN